MKRLNQTMTTLVCTAVAAVTTTAWALQPEVKIKITDEDTQDDRPPAWAEAEHNALKNHVQLTAPDRFVKAGEAYFSPDDSKIIFQAVARPKQGQTADEFYAMFVADVTYDDSNHITGLENIRRISPEGSANTCGWFHPTKKNTVIFGSTIDAPQKSDSPGYQRGTGRYKWQFPPGMNIVQVNLDEADGTAEPLTLLAGKSDAYAAECSISADGRYLLYASLESNEGDIFIKDLRTGAIKRLVDAPGYDGGPFFSPDDRRICYRSDRRGDNLLQVYVAQLRFNEQNRIVRVDREFQLTNSAHVNWAPFWHPDGRHLVYTTSELGHDNYEIFIMDAAGGREVSAEQTAGSSTGTARYGTAKRRVTHADGFDGLPVFNSDGSIMMWTSQRGEQNTSQIWAANFVMNLDPMSESKLPRIADESDLRVKDPETGIIYIYNTNTHELTAYNPSSHEQREVTSQQEIRKAMRLFKENDSDE